MKKKAYKKSRIPIPLRVINWLFPKLEKASPWLASRWFYRLFFRTARYPVPDKEQAVADKAKQYQVPYRGKHIQVYEWGEGTPVLMLHGWMGRGTQFFKFVSPFTEVGFRVITFDASGHGKSDGRKSHLREFIDVIHVLKEQNPELTRAVGHSLGGVALMHAAIAHNFERLVMIGSPARADLILDEYRYRIGASEKVLPYFNRKFIADNGDSFEAYTAIENVHRLTDTQLLLIHDQDDQEVPLANAEAMKQKRPEATLMVTRQLGHTRILKDDKVIETALQFIHS